MFGVSWLLVDRNEDLGPTPSLTKRRVRIRVDTHEVWWGSGLRFYIRIVKYESVSVKEVPRSTTDLWPSPRPSPPMSWAKRSFTSGVVVVPGSQFGFRWRGPSGNRVDNRSRSFCGTIVYRRLLSFGVSKVKKGTSTDKPGIIFRQRCLSTSTLPVTGRNRWTLLTRSRWTI